MYKLGINFDEISDDLAVAISVMKNQKVNYGELRTVGKKNFVYWNDADIQNFKHIIDLAGIKVVAAATPLFKWYDNDYDQEVKHDNFGFNPRLSHLEKKQIINKALVIASELEIPRLRIFSGLGNLKGSGVYFAGNDLLNYALDVADKYNIDLYIENEPVCKVHTKEDMLGVLKANNHPRLKLWLDIANLIEIGEEADSAFIHDVASRLGYIHIKDFITKGSHKRYVAAGNGLIPYVPIMRIIHSVKPDDVIVTVETHATVDKVNTSIASIIGTRNILEAAGVDYE